MIKNNRKMIKIMSLLYTILGVKYAISGNDIYYFGDFDHFLAVTSVVPDNLP